MIQKYVLVFTFTDDTSLDEAGIADGAKIHLMMKKGETVSPSGSASSSKNMMSFPAAKTSASPPTIDFFAQLDSFLGKHLTQEQTAKVVNEFKKVHVFNFLIYINLEQ